MKLLGLYILLITCFFGKSHSDKTVFYSKVALHQTDDICSQKNITTQNGERTVFIVFYELAGVYVNAGIATFTNTLEKYNGEAVYHIRAEGHTNSSYDWFYKVRDMYETYMDTTTLRPFRFVRNINEGGFKHTENVLFNHTAKTVTSDKGTYKVPACIHDILSAVFSCRNINFEHYKKNDKIPFDIFLDDQVYNMYIRYLGKEKVKTKYGVFDAIKFSPLLIEGTLFKGGEKMTVWVSDDRNHIPLRIESPIVVGNIKVDMMGYKNLRYPLSSLKKLND